MGDPDVFFADHFDNQADFTKKWIKSQAKKEGVTDESIAKYDGEWSLEQSQKDPLNGDLGLVLKTKAKHAAIAAPLGKIYKFEDKPFVVQYELNFQDGQDCGGGYIKLLSHSKNFDLREFRDSTPYTIMFGPDKCGSDSKLHFIFRHVNPKNQTITEKHCKKLETKERGILEECFKDKRPHLYRLVIKPDNSFEIYIDYNLVNYGTLVDHFDPPVNPPAEIDDPNDFKPDDWDEDMDGEWEAPLVPNPMCQSAPGCGSWKKPFIDNPLYKGKWFPPMINNPNYKGKWKPRKIPNPEYFHDDQPFKMTAIGGLGIELWSMSSNLYFDNLIITDNTEIADAWAKDTYDLKMQKLDVTDAGLFKRILNYSNRNPWLYAVYVVVIGLPLVLIITFCCSSSSSKPQVDQHPKKTDAVQEDVLDAEPETEEVEDEEGDEDEEEEEEEDTAELIPEESDQKRASPRR